MYRICRTKLFTYREYLGGEISADVIWGKKFEKGKRKREKM